MGSQFCTSVGPRKHRSRVTHRLDLGPRYRFWVEWPIQVSALKRRLQMHTTAHITLRSSERRRYRCVSAPVLVVLVIFAVLSAALLPVKCMQTQAAIQEEPESKISKINHIIVIYQENWSFDSLYGKFPGANGLANANSTIPQVDKNGVAMTTLPQPINNNVSPAVPDSRFPANMPVAPYDLSQFVPANQVTGDIIHRFYHEQLQIDGGKMDKFVTWSDNGGLVFSYFDASKMPEGRLAKKYVMCDNWFHSAFGGSFLITFSLSLLLHPHGPTRRPMPLQTRIQPI